MSSQKAQFDIYIEKQAAGTSRTVYRTFKLPGDWYIESCEFMPDDSITADNTDYTTVTLTNVTDTVTIQTKVTTVAGTGTTAGTRIAASLTEGTARILTDGDKLSAAKADSGAGKALGGTFSLYLSRRRT